jgi:hypothetical protein
MAGLAIAAALREALSMRLGVEGEEIGVSVGPGHRKWSASIWMRSARQNG